MATGAGAEFVSDEQRRIAYCVPALPSGGVSPATAALHRHSLSQPPGAAADVVFVRYNAPGGGEEGAEAQRLWTMAQVPAAALGRWPEWQALAPGTEALKEMLGSDLSWDGSRLQPAPVPGPESAPRSDASGESEPEPEQATATQDAPQAQALLLPWKTARNDE